MKKIATFLFISILILSNNFSYCAAPKDAQNHNDSSQTSDFKEKDKPPKKHKRAISPIPICTSGNLICVLGNYTFSSNNLDKPIYIDFGIMCTTDGGICTNGSQIITTNRVVYR